MLNEKLEYEQYTYPTDSPAPAVRLKHKKITNKLSGTARAMTVIARGSYYRDGTVSADPSDCEDRIERARNDLMLWCGDSRGDPAKATDEALCGWLPQYIINVLAPPKIMALEEQLDSSDSKMISSPHYKEACALLRSVCAGLSADTFSDSVQKDQLLENSKTLESYCKEMDVEKYSSPVINIIDALNTLYNNLKRNGYNSALFTDKLIKSDKNDFKKISYEGSIADAITAGPLKRYYLVCRDDNFSQIRILKKDKPAPASLFTKNAKPEEWLTWGNPAKNKVDMLMKTISAYLLEQMRRGADNRYDILAPVNNTDIFNWTVGSSDNCMPPSLKNYLVNDRPLVETDVRDNITFIHFDPQWMRECGWQVITEEELDASLSEDPDLVFFSDSGAGEYLYSGKNVRYR